MLDNLNSTNSLSDFSSAVLLNDLSAIISLNEFGSKAIAYETMFITSV